MEGVIDRYKVIMRLGEGGMAEVDLAVVKGRSGFSKLVVLKKLRSALVSDAEMHRMFTNEARISARMNHPNIVQVNEIIEQEGAPVIVMEYLDGQSLDQILGRTSEGTLPPSVHLYIITRVLRALEYAHSFVDFDGNPIEVVHRDVSPHNVFVTYNGDVKLLDFGIAVLGAQGENDSGMLQGKLHYMSPEQVLSESVDRRSDLYAVGVMLWEMASGRRMWKNASEDTILNAVANGELPELTLAAGVPAALKPVIERALKTSVDERYSSAAEMQRDLAPILAELADDAHETVLAKLVSELFTDKRQATRTEITRHLHDAGLAASESSAAEVVTISRELPRRRRRMFAAGFGVVVLVGILAMFLVRSHPVATNTPLVTVVPLATDEHLHPAGMVDPMLPDVVEIVQTIGTLAAPDVQVPEGPVTSSVTIAVFPEKAELLVDGVRVANPFHERRTLDGKPHVITSQAPGFMPHTENVVFTEDQFLTIRLDPVAVHIVRHTPTTHTVARNNCDPPYTIDERGIRRYKIECLQNH